VVQALPGPLFNFSAYLGAIIAMNAGYSFIVGAVLAWFGLFAPGVLIIFGECDCVACFSPPGSRDQCILWGCNLHCMACTRLERCQGLGLI
jgi:hypothetical protein